MEKSLIGLKEGDKIEVIVPPSKGFGERKKDLYQEVPRSIIEEKVQPEPGDWIELKAEDGNRHLATVQMVKPDSILLDLNHPLSGQTIKFEIEVIKIQK